MNLKVLTTYYYLGLSGWELNRFILVFYINYNVDTKWNTFRTLKVDFSLCQVNFLSVESRL